MGARKNPLFGQLTINDATEQSAEVAFSLAEKLDIARHLGTIGQFPALSQRVARASGRAVLKAWLKGTAEEASKEA